MAFYHASNVGNLKEILPLSSDKKSGEKVAYLTPLRACALFYLRDMEINHVTCWVSGEGMVGYEEQFPNQLEIIYKGRSGYLYICDNSNPVTAGHTNGVWVARQPATIARVEYVEDVYAEIIQAERDGKIEVRRYESHTPERRAEIDEMIRSTIITNNYLTCDSAKARFFADNFRQAWKRAGSSAE